MEEEAAIWGKGAREGAEAEAHFGLSASSYYPPLLPQGDGGGPLILTRSATHVKSAVWHRRRSSEVEVNVEDGAREVAGDDSDSSSSSPPPPSVLRFTGPSDRRGSIVKTSTA